MHGLTARAQFQIGQAVHHKRYGYRGVIVDVDATFQHSEEWYAYMCRASQPPRDRPWYHVLVHGSRHRTYVTEQNLEPDDSGEPIVHPDLTRFFDDYFGGLYRSRRAAH